MPVFKVKGMSCQHCVMRVTRALESIEGIRNVKVDLESGEASFDEDAPVDRKVLAERVRKAGYEIG